MRTIHKVRAVILQDPSHLVLIRRTRPGLPVYWVLPGGGVEDTDSDLEDALAREIFEELGATITILREILAFTNPAGGTTHIFLCRLLTLNPALRNGPEFSDPSRGDYDIEIVPIKPAALSQIDLRPEVVKQFLLSNSTTLCIGPVQPGANTDPVINDSSPTV